MASSLLASTQSSPVPADLLSSSYVIHCSTTWCLHTGSTFRSLFPPTFLVYCHIMQDSSFCVFVRLFFLNYRQSTAMQTNDGFVSILLYVKKVFLLWKIIWSSWNSVLFSTSFTLFLAVLALNKLLTLKNNVAIHILCSPPSPQDLPCNVHLDAILESPLFFTAYRLWLCQMRLCHSKFLSSALLSTSSN